MPRRWRPTTFERQRQQHPLPARRECFAALAVDLAQDGAKLLQVFRRNEAVLREQLAVGRFVGEQFDHQPRHLDAGGFEVDIEPGVGEKLPNLRVLGQIGRSKRWLQRGAENDVVAHRQFVVVAIAIEQRHECASSGIMTLSRIRIRASSTRPESAGSASPATRLASPNANSSASISTRRSTVSACARTSSMPAPPEIDPSGIDVIDAVPG